MSINTEVTSFKALLAEECGTGQYQQRVVERALADLPEGELLVEVHFSSLNYKDALSAFGNKGVTRSYPHTPGIDAAGLVVEDSSGRFKPGDSVIVIGYDLGMNTAGGLGQYISVPANWASPLPEGLSLREAMAFGTAGFTAALCIEKIQSMGARPEDGDVAVTGASGGVGCFSVALLSSLGFNVAAITGKLEESEFLVSLGARQVIDRETLMDVASRPVAKPVWAWGIDSLGGDYLFNLLKSISYQGGVAACGLAAGSEFSANVFPFILRGVSLLGVDSVQLPLSQKTAVWARLASDMKLDSLDTMVQEISLEQVPAHLAQIYNGHARGRYLVNLKDA